MKRSILLLSLILCLGWVLPAHAVTITSSGLNLEFDKQGVTQFLEMHTDVSLEMTDWNYSTTLELANMLITRSLDGDFYVLAQDMLNREILMSKGFCLDLSDSKILTGMVDRLHPHIAEQLMYDGHLYAWPFDMTFSYMRIELDAWNEADLTIEDIPKSFPAFLDFLDRWCDRMENDPDLNIHVMGGIDEYPELTEGFYVDWLLELLIHQVVMQQQYAGESLHFDDEEICTLIHRCDDIGRRIYWAESQTRMGRIGLFTIPNTFEWPETEEYLVYLRLNDSQPKLIEARMGMVSINPATKYPELCVELLERFATSPAGMTPIDQYIFKDAQPRTMVGYEENLAAYQAQIERIDHQLKDSSLSAEESLQLNEELALYNMFLEDAVANKWKIKPAALADYKSHVGLLYFPVPSILTETDAGSQIAKLRGQVSDGAISVDQFIRRLREIVLMIQLEQ